MRIIYIFIDGIGIGKPDKKYNPFTLFARSFLIPLGTPFKELKNKNGWNLIATDAHLGIIGLPQSATGQSSLWTGINCPEAMGYHKTGFPGPALVKIIDQYSIVKIALKYNKKASLLNAYGAEYLQRDPRLISASTHVQLASEQPLKSLSDLEKGGALFMDITNEYLVNLYPEMRNSIPVIAPYEKGKDIVRILKEYDLILFEYFLSDWAGHEQSLKDAQDIIFTLEEFIRGITETLNESEELLIITSDHGNMEDMSTGQHTNNFVPTFAYGLKADQIHNTISTIADIPGFIYDHLNIPFQPKANFSDSQK